MAGGKSAGWFWAGWLAQACGICVLFMLVALLGATPGQAAFALVVAFGWAVYLLARLVGRLTSPRA